MVTAGSGQLPDDLIHRAAELGCAGVCFLGRGSMRGQAEERVAAADRLGLALLYGDESTSCGDLYQAFYSTETASSLQQTLLEALPSYLATSVLQGGTLDDIASIAAKELSAGVVISQVDGRPWAVALEEDLRGDLLAAGLLDSDGRLHVERSMHGRALTSTGEVRIVDITAGEEILARLIVARRVGAFEPAELVALADVATVAAFVITRQQAVRAVEGRYRGDFLRDVFESRAGGPAEIIEYAAGLGWDLDRSMAVVVVHLDPITSDLPTVTGLDQRTWHDRFALAWRQVIGRRDRSIPVVYTAGEVVVLLPADPAGVRLEKTVNSILTAVRGDGGGGRRSFSTGVSRVVTDLRRLPDAYQQALKALEVGTSLSGPGSLTFFDQLGVLKLMAFVPEDELRSFVHEVLGELASEDDSARDLHDTLHALVETNFNLAETARVQMYHYNTIRARLLRLKAMLGDFDVDARRRLDVSMALQIHAMLPQRRRDNARSAPPVVGWN